MSSQRADFTRNERRILDAAARLLADAPASGMAELASEAGLGRATLYRHFPTREALIEGLRLEAFDAVVDVIERYASEPVQGRLRRLVEALLEVGVRYRIVFAAPTEERHAQEVRDRFDVPITVLVEEAQAAGEIDPELPARWLLVALGGTIGSVLREIAEGRMAVAEGRRLLVQSLFGGFGARG